MRQVTSEFPVVTPKTTVFIDVAIPNLKLAFESDGSYFHKDKKNDRKRDELLRKQGWTVYHFKADYPEDITIKLVEKKLWKVLK